MIKRRPQLYGLARVTKPRRHHANHGVGFRIEAYRLV